MISIAMINQLVFKQQLLDETEQAVKLNPPEMLFGCQEILPFFYCLDATDLKLSQLI